jgi:hypothetical protein
VAAAEQNYEAALPYGENRQIAILATRKETAKNFHAVERDRVAALVKAIETRDVDAAHRAKLVIQAQDRRTLATMDELARQVDAEIVSVGGKLTKLIGMAQGLGADLRNGVQSGVTNRSVQLLKTGAAYALVHSGAVSDIQNASEIRLRRDLPHVCQSVDRIAVLLNSIRDGAEVA